MATIPAPPSSISTWQVLFSQDCSLKCRYCATRQGTYGLAAAFMQEPVWQRLADLAMSWSDGILNLTFNLGGGETFLRYAPFMTFKSHLDRKARRFGRTIRWEVCTNGIHLDAQRVSRIADERINLMFSIDGPADYHDRQRVTSDGRGTHSKSLAAWKAYRRACQRGNHRTGCSVQSVIADDHRLDRVHHFWMQQDVDVYEAVIQSPKRWLSDVPPADLTRRRAAYLQDLSRIAEALTRRTAIPNFLSDFRGPSILLKLWTAFLFDDKNPAPRSCGAGEKMLAVSADGKLYPCEGFVGSDRWCLGNLWQGIRKERYAAFLNNCRNNLRFCMNCDLNAWCQGACHAAQGADTMVVNSPGGCAFSRELIGVARETYNIMSGGK